jgi:hypothetical protein
MRARAAESAAQRPIDDGGSTNVPEMENSVEREEVVDWEKLLFGDGGWEETVSDLQIFDGLNEESETSFWQQ